MKVKKKTREALERLEVFVNEGRKFLAMEGGEMKESYLEWPYATFVGTEEDLKELTDLVEKIKNE